MPLLLDSDDDKVKLKIALTGVSGSGKTYSALRLARGIVGAEGKILVVDTEGRSARLYKNKIIHQGVPIDYTHIRLVPPYRIEDYFEAINMAETKGFDVLILDSISHAWNGSGGLLERHDDVSKRMSGKSFNAWSEITPLHNEFISRIINAEVHIIATMRSKTDYLVSTNENGKMSPQKIGLAPIQREGMDYEFDIVLDIDKSHLATASKDRTSELDGNVFLITEAVGERIGTWVEERIAALPETQDKKAFGVDMSEILNLKPTQNPPKTQPKTETKPRPKNLYDADQVAKMRAGYAEKKWSDAIIDKAKLEGEELWDGDMITADWKARREVAEQIKQEKKPAGVCPNCKKNQSMTAEELEVFNGNCDMKGVKNIQQTLCLECAMTELKRRISKDEPKPEPEKKDTRIRCGTCNGLVSDGVLKLQASRGFEKPLCEKCYTAWLNEEKARKDKYRCATCGAEMEEGTWKGRELFGDIVECDECEKKHGKKKGGAA